MDFDRPLFAFRPPYGPHLNADWETLDFMSDIGIDAVCVSPMNTTNSLGEPYTNYPNVWRYDDTYDFALVDRQFRDILRHCPNARLIVLVDLNSPLWLARRLSIDSFYDVSSCSLHPEWRRQVTAYLHAFLDHCETTWPDRIIAYVLACGRTQEWIEADNAKPSSLKSAHYPDWCRQRQLPLLPIPRADELRSSSSPYPWLYHPDQDRHLIQWLRYVNELTTELAIHFVREARQHTRPDVRLGMFFGHVHAMLPTGQMDCERLFRTQPPDFLIGAACNCAPQMGSASGYTTVYRTDRRFGFGFIHENDRLTTTSNRHVSPDIALEGGIWVKPDSTAADVAMVRRETGLCLVHHFSTWWFNIWGQSYKTPEIRSALRRSREIWSQHCLTSSGSAAQAVFVFDPDASYHLNRHAPGIANLAWPFRQTLYTYGIPFDNATLDDLIQDGADQYRLFIFQNPSCLDDSRLQWLRTHVLKPGNAVLWMLPPALDHDGKLDPELAAELAGCPPETAEFHRATLPSGTLAAACFQPTLLNKQRFRQLAQDAGVHLYADDDQTVFCASPELLMAHRAEPADVTIRLPKPAHTIRELYSDTLVATDTDHFTDHFDGPDTKLYLLR